MVVQAVQKVVLNLEGEERAEREELAAEECARREELGAEDIKE